MASGRKDRKRNLQEFFLPLAGKPLHYVEVGVWEGVTLDWMATNVLTNQASVGHGVDPWLAFGKYDQAKLDECHEKSQYVERTHHPRVKLHRTTSLKFFAKEHAPFDIAYVDGEHTTRALLFDLMLVFPQMKKGGVILVDDVPGPRRSTYAGLCMFSSVHFGEFELLRKNYQAVLKKL